MYNILVTGSSGQLGSEIKAISQNYEHNFFFRNSQELDITNYELFKQLIVNQQINVIINCAAYTAVDKAESEPELANAINHLAVNQMAELAKLFNIKLIHISTDYVFDGSNNIPYLETDLTNPQGVYGKTKLDGELAMQRVNPTKSIIIRTSWVYSKYGNNFVKTMMRLAESKNELSVVADQIGSPTNAADLAKCILDILPKVKNEKVVIYNYSNEGSCSWYEFANEIFKINKVKIKVNPVSSDQFPVKAKRPNYSLLNKSKIKKDFNLNIQKWEVSLNKMFNEKF